MVNKLHYKVNYNQIRIENKVGKKLRTDCVIDLTRNLIKL